MVEFHLGMTGAKYMLCYILLETPFDTYVTFSLDYARGRSPDLKLQTQTGQTHCQQVSSYGGIATASLVLSN